jgi:hypothetical protein
VSAAAGDSPKETCDCGTPVQPGCSCFECAARRRHELRLDRKAAEAVGLLRGAIEAAEAGRWWAATEDAGEAHKLAEELAMARWDAEKMAQAEERSAARLPDDDLPF